MKYLPQIPNILNLFYKNNYCSDRPERRLFAPGSKYAEPLPVFFYKYFCCSFMVFACPFFAPMSRHDRRLVIFYSQGFGCISFSSFLTADAAGYLPSTFNVCVLSSRLHNPRKNYNPQIMQEP